MQAQTRSQPHASISARTANGEHSGESSVAHTHHRFPNLLAIAIHVHNGAPERDKHSKSVDFVDEPRQNGQSQAEFKRAKWHASSVAAAASARYIDSIRGAQDPIWQAGQRKRRDQL